MRAVYHRPGWRQLHRGHAGAERFDETGGCLLPRCVGVQHCVQALPLAEQLQRRRAETGPAQRQRRHAPLLQCEQIEWPLDDTDATSVATGLIPPQQRLGTR